MRTSAEGTADGTAGEWLKMLKDSPVVLKDCCEGPKHPKNKSFDMLLNEMEQFSAYNNIGYAHGRCEVKDHAEQLPTNQHTVPINQ